MQIVLPDFVEAAEWSQTDTAQITKVRNNVWEVEFQAPKLKPVHFLSMDISDNGDAGIVKP